MTQPTIMVVDDESAIRNLIVTVLEDEGYRAVGVPSGVAALEAFPSEQPDAILLDLMMPVLDGRETLRRLRQLPGGAEAPVVIMSAAISSSVGDDSVVAFLAKPFDLIALLDTIESVLADRNPATRAGA